MNETSSATGLREKLPLAPQREEYFHWRGREISRVEGLTDAVFAFAVTLLVVSLEVPRNFGGLLDVLRGFPAFVICFTLLMTFWNAHYRYHRRYGLEDGYSRFLTMAVLVLVLFFVYPLKFLFTMVTVNVLGLDLTDPPHLETRDQVVVLYVVYGLGFAGVWTLYALLYRHALKNQEVLALTPPEVLATRGDLMANLIYVGVCALSVALAVTTRSDWLPGVVYFLLGPLQAFNGRWFARRAQRAAAAPKGG